MSTCRQETTNKVVSRQWQQLELGSDAVMMDSSVQYRPSVFFSTRADGMLDAWDYYLNSQTAPALSTQVLSSPPSGWPNLGRPKRPGKESLLLIMPVTEPCCVSL